MKNITFLNEESLVLVVGGDVPPSQTLQICLSLPEDNINSALCPGVGLIGDAEEDQGLGLLDVITSSAATLANFYACSVSLNISVAGENKHHHHHHHH